MASFVAVALRSRCDVCQRTERDIHCGREDRSSRGLVYLDENDVCTGFGKANGDGCTDASRAACDEGSLALEGEE